MSKKIGAMNDEFLRKLVDQNFIKGASVDNIGPASLDLSISGEVYRVSGVLQARLGESIRSLVERIDALPHPALVPFERDVVYLARLNESLALPDNIYGYCNPKSSTGRHDVHVRVLADGVPRYDAVTPAGFNGELWALIVPHSYPVIIPEGEPLSQLRLFNGNTRLSEEETQVAFAEWNPLYSLKGKRLSYEDTKIRDGDGSIILTLDLKSEIIGYEYTGQQRIIDFSKGKKAYDAHDFFEPIKRPRGDYLFVRRGSFLILSTAEAVRVPPCFACEMRPMDARSGEFRSHYAGFIDPGWGYGREGEGKGRPLTLEVRPHEDLMIHVKQPIAKIRFENMATLPTVHYDQKVECNYSGQFGPKLAKHFR